jgi:hypothetical protein
MLLSIGQNEQKALLEAVERARAKPLTLQQVMRGAKSVDQSTNVLTLAERKMMPEPRHAQHVELPYGYRVAISFEEQPAGMCLHLSMSSSTPGKVPHPEAIAMVLAAIGVTRSATCRYPDCDGGYATGYCHADCRSTTASRTWIEEFEIDGETGGLAVNVVMLDPFSRKG